MAKTKQTKEQKQRQLRRDALLLFKIINDKSIPQKARQELSEYVDDVCSSSQLFDPHHNKTCFLKTFVDGYGRDTHARRNMQTILNQLKAGKSADEVVAWVDEKREAHYAKMQEEEDAQPEPRSKLSKEWRYWKIRQLTRAFTSNDLEAYTAAWKEFRALLTELVTDPDFYHISFAIALLPHLLIARQEIAVMVRPKRQKGGAKR